MVNTVQVYAKFLGHNKNDPQASPRTAMELSFIERDDKGLVIEEKSIRNVRARSGSGAWNGSNRWERGKAPIPTSDLVVGGTLYLWVERSKIQQYDDLDATGREIGRFYPISSSKENHRLIKGLDGSERWDIGFHDDNDIPNSLGCVVTPDNPKFRQICTWLEDRAARGFRQLLLEVF